MITLPQLLDNAKCFETVRALRWPDKVSCPHCGSEAIIKQGKDDTQPERQRYSCKACQRKFDDLTGTIFAGPSISENLGAVPVFHGLELIERADCPRVGFR